jgi:hypothetical protein
MCCDAHVPSNDAKVEVSQLTRRRAMPHGLRKESSLPFRHLQARCVSDVVVNPRETWQGDAMKGSYSIRRRFTDNVFLKT